MFERYPIMFSNTHISRSCCWYKYKYSISYAVSLGDMNDNTVVLARNRITTAFLRNRASDSAFQNDQSRNPVAFA